MALYPQSISFRLLEIDLNKSDEFKLPSAQGPLQIPVFYLKNPKLRKPFRVELTGPVLPVQFHYIEEPLDIAEFAHMFEQIVEDVDQYRQVFWVYDPNDSFDNNYNPDLTNFVSCEIRYMWTWTPTSEMDIAIHGSEPIEIFIVFVNCEIPVDNFERLSNFNPPY